MKYGEIIELGRHKLMCGDATSREDVMRLVDGVKVDLVLTDPPGLSSKLCMRFFLGYFREPFSVSNIEVA